MHCRCLSCASSQSYRQMALVAMPWAIWRPVEAICGLPGQCFSKNNALCVHPLCVLVTWSLLCTLSVEMWACCHRRRLLRCTMGTEVYRAWCMSGQMRRKTKSDMMAYANGHRPQWGWASVPRGADRRCRLRCSAGLADRREGVLGWIGSAASVSHSGCFKLLSSSSALLEAGCQSKAQRAPMGRLEDAMTELCKVYRFQPLSELYLSFHVW